jgi:DNA invertase Pin-like site-specific DNA recombinase
MGDTSKAVAYLRVSTEDQRLGPEAQRAAIGAWARREGVEVVAWHVDHGVSGGSELDARQGLVGALGELRASKAGVLVVAKRDRLARDSGIAIAIERAVEASGARVVNAEGAGNGDGPADTFMRRMLDAAAEYERALIRARTKAALAAKRAKGERAGEVPFGYSLAADGRTLESDAGEQAVIAAARELRAEGRALRAVVAALAERGMVSRAGKPLALAQVHRIVSRRAA